MRNIPSLKYQNIICHVESRNILTDLFSFHPAAPVTLCFILDSLQHKEQARMWSCSRGSVHCSSLPPESPSKVNLLGSCSGVTIEKRSWLPWKDWRCLNTSVSFSSSVFYKWKFWYPGEAGPQLILMIIFITNNGGYTEHPFSVTSGEITELSLL